MPALPLDTAGKYVAGAYIVFLALILIYVAIMAVKLQRIEAQMREIAESREQSGDDRDEPSTTAGNARAAVGGGEPESRSE